MVAIRFGGRKELKLEMNNHVFFLTSENEQSHVAINWNWKISNCILIKERTQIFARKLYEIQNKTLEDMFLFKMASWYWLEEKRTKTMKWSMLLISKVNNWDSWLTSMVMNWSSFFYRVVDQGIVTHFLFDDRGPGALEGRLSPPLAFESTSPAVTPVYQKPPGVRRYMFWT